MGTEWRTLFNAVDHVHRVHGELVVLSGTAAGVVSWAVATALERSHAVRERLSSLTGLGER